MKRAFINSIYRATEGEGVFIGSPQVFVRFQGCAIGCLNCDSTDTWDFDQNLEMALDDVLLRVSEESLGGKISRVSITGGDPLHPAHQDFLIQLIKELKARRYFVNIEAAGSRLFDEVFDALDFISFDIKTPSTGVKTPFKNIEKLLNQYSKKSQIKSVIETRHDFEYCLNLLSEISKIEGRLETPWVLTPSYNLKEEFPVQRFKEIIDWNELAGAPFRVIGQQHKWIFGPDKKLV